MNNDFKKNAVKTFRRSVMLAAVLLAVVLVPWHAFALTVSPARIEISGDAGKVTTSELQVFNEEATGNTFYFSTANFQSEGEDGTPDFVSGNDGLASWIKTPDSIVLAPGEQQKIPFSISVPAGTPPGGYFAGIFLSTTPTNATGSGQVSIGAKVGILVLFRVNGAISEKGGILEFNTADGGAWYTALPVSFEYRFQNSGGDRVLPDGTVAIKDMIGITAASVPANPDKGNVLPFGSIRKFEITWGNPTDAPANAGFFGSAEYEWQHFAFGRYSANLSLSYGDQGQTVQAKTVFYVIPWQLLVLIILTLLIIFFLGRFLIHRYNNWAIHEAEEILEHEHPELMNEGMSRPRSPMQSPPVQPKKMSNAPQNAAPRKRPPRRIVND